MANAYTQDIILDADGKPVLDALTLVRNFMDQIQKVVTGIGVTTLDDAKKWQQALSLNLKMLKQAESDLKTLQTDKSNRTKGFQDAEANAKRTAQIEVRADKEANRQKVIEAKVTYGEKARLAREEASIEKQLAKEIADFEKSQDRAAIASAKEVAAARREAATAAVTAKARGITNTDDALAAKAASDARLNQLRRERETVAANDANAARGIANRIAVEKALGTALDGTIRKLNQQAEAERRAQDAATRRLTGQLPAAGKLLAPGNVRDEVIRSGDARSTLVGYQFEQENARRQLQASIGDRNATLEQVTAARQRLELANANVAAAERLVREEQKLVEIDRRLAASQRVEQQKAQLALAGQYAREQINALGPKEAIRRAVEATAIAEQRLAAASTEHVAAARMELELAKAQQAATEKQGKAGPLQSLLTASYAATAFARTAIYGAAAGAAYGVFNGVQGGLEQVVQMEDELAKLQAIANATEPQLQKIKAAIYDIGSTSRFSVIDLAKISQTLAQAGVTASDMRSVLASVTTLATASGSTPDEAVNLVTSALGSFQLQASEAGRVADLMTSALNRTKLTVQQTGQAIQYVGATAYEQNISLETLLATVGAVAQAGVRSGSTIGTGFRQFLVDLSNPSEKLNTQLKALKLTAADVDVSVRGLPAVLETLQKAGFGAGQAYAGLETRAAAFYLVAKNNVDVMDQLQLSFATSGAAAVANERAMNSLTAQWQRFKNILAEGLSESMETPLNILKNVLTAISDRIEESRKAADDIRKQNAEGTQAWYNTDLAPAGEEGIRRTFNILGNTASLGLNSPFQKAGGVNPLTGQGTGFGDWLDSWTKKSDGATAASERLQTQVSETSDTVDKQTGKITELDKEMARLAVQKDTLRGNDIRSGAEIATLTSRFEGLAVYLTNTGNRYDDLTNAVQRYRQAQMQLLNTDLTAQGSALALQTADAKQRGSAAISGIQGNSSLMAQLSPQERGALSALQKYGTGSPQSQRAQGILGDAVKRFTDNDPNNGGFNRDLADRLNQVVQAAGTIATNTAQANIITTRVADNTAAMTGEGRKITNDQADIQNLITRLGSATGVDQTKLGTEGLGKVNALDKYINGLLANKSIQGANRNFLQNALTDVTSLRNQINATLEPTKAEAREAARLQREKDKQEKLVNQSDIDRIGQALGLKLGSGTRTAAEQDAMHRAGKTPATGKTSPHVVGLARDFGVGGLSDAEAERYAATMRAQYRAAGINAQVQYETGKGKNQGTGRHIHVGVRKGTTRRADRTEENEDKYDVKLDQAQLALDQANLATQLKEVARATTKETFDTSVAAAKAALDKVNGQLKDQALNELAASGIAPGSTQFNARMLQVQQTIAQNVEDFNQKVTDAIIKSVEKQTKAAATAFEQATQSANASLQTAQAQVTGLDSYSLRNKVPDYVKSLANDRVAMAQENVTKAQYTALPAQISAQQTAMSTLQSTIGSAGVNPETVNAQLATMNVELQKLMANREALGAQLNAGGLLPTSFSDGLNKAIEAYRQANNMNQTFSQSLIMNLGGALDTVNTGLATMFTSIMDGSQSALGAFASFAKGIMQWMVQLAAKAVATQIMNLLLNLGASFLGSKAAPAASGGTQGFVGPPAFKGGTLGDDGKIYRKMGGSVENGSTAADSVDARLARGEWVVQKKSVDSVGNKFMARLNQHGAKALDSLQAVPKLDMKNHTETNVYVVPAAQQPTLGPNDVRVILNDELMNGDGKRLVQHIASDR